MPLPFPSGSLQDRDQDGVIDYVNVRVYVADRPLPVELAAAANVAARFAFESLSLDLPIGQSVSSYDASDESIAIVIGSAARRFARLDSEAVFETRDRNRRVIAIPSSFRAESWAATLSLANPLEEPQQAAPVDSIPSKNYSLAQIYSIRGLLGDSTGDFLPDRTDTKIFIGPASHSPKVIDLAARIALESTGLRLPLTVVARSGQDLQNPVLIGMANPHVQELIARGQLQTDLKSGEGRIEIVPDAFARGDALVVLGSDDDGEAAALELAAERLPYAWTYGKENLHLDRIEDDLRLFFSQRSPAAQAAAALYTARRMTKTLEGRELESSRLQISVERSEQGLLESFREEFRQFGATVRNLDVQSADTVFEETLDMDWEVDDARARVTSAVFPAIVPGSTVRLELRLSEPFQIREKLSNEIRRSLLERGADPQRTQVQVLPAHKQAYGWIVETLKPQLKGATHINISFCELAGSDGQRIESPIRWLQELYPIDEVLARDLDISVDQITFERTSGGPTYRVEARDSAGAVLLDASFEPRSVFRPMFDQFPDYAQVRVGTGWVRAEVDGSLLLDERIPTDPERFWDQFQSRTLANIHDYMVKLHDESPLPQSGPYFGSLEVDVTLSEPDYRIGIDEERISTLEALHEDIYFETILFFDVLGRHYTGEPLRYPGRVIPRVNPSSDGAPPRASVRFTGTPGPEPAVGLVFQELGKSRQRWRRELRPTTINPPRILGATVRSGHDGVLSLEVLQRINAPHKTVASGGNDRRFTVEQAVEMLNNIREFHRAGYGLDWLSWEGIESLTVRLVDINGITKEVELPQTDRGYYSTPKIAVPSGQQVSIVDFQESLNSAATRRCISALAQFSEVRPYYAGRSLLGRPIWALDVMSPSPGKFLSQAKASVTKPVFFITGRQHGNEVSSTSHILKLVEVLVSDRQYRSLLDRVNFVVQPMTNPDGADLAHELGMATPDFMLHAGYFGSLGVDVATGQWKDDPIYPEARVRRALWEMWLPDVVLDAHGYPSHEWVQLFASYSAWVQDRSTERRDWWIPRGCFLPHFGYLDTPQYPHHKNVALEIRDRLLTAMSGATSDINERMWRRYEKYGQWDPETYKTSFHRGGLVYSAPGQLRPDAGSNSFMCRYPQVTVFAGTIEVPDETARGKWLERVAEAGLQSSLAVARFLAESTYHVQRSTERVGKDTLLTIRRRRPVLPHVLENST